MGKTSSYSSGKPGENVGRVDRWSVVSFGSWTVGMGLFSSAALRCLVRSSWRVDWDLYAGRFMDQYAKTTCTVKGHRTYFTWSWRRVRSFG